MENVNYNQNVAEIEAMTIEPAGGLLTHLEGRHDAHHLARLLPENLAKRHCPHCGGDYIVKFFGINELFENNRQNWLDLPAERA